MRNRWIDLLRAVAIVRVVVYHLYGWPWLTVLMPAMGVMFAVAGSLTAASLERRSAGTVVGARLRRLLPPLWLLAAVAVPAMVLAGGDPPGWRVVYWLLPLGDPPGSQWGADLWEPLWYLRAYLWFVLASPVLHRLYRHTGWLAVAAPLALLPALAAAGIETPGAWDFATYGACWVAGFAHQDGRLARLPLRTLLPAVGALAAAALWWLAAHPGAGVDLNEIPPAQALWSLAFVLVVLWWQPPTRWLDRVPGLPGAVRLVNARAVTVYLWHNPAIALAFPALAAVGLGDLGRLDPVAALVAAVVLTTVCTAATGWAEDLAAGRRPGLLPGAGPRRRRPAPRRANHWTHGPGASPAFHRLGRHPDPRPAPSAPGTAVGRAGVPVPRSQEVDVETPPVPRSPADGTRT
jgi:peptidoglycan/LPS O-acetylase OafA/YrhL